MTSRDLMRAIGLILLYGGLAIAFVVLAASALIELLTS